MTKQIDEMTFKKFGDLFKAISIVRKELSIFGYDFKELTIDRGDNINIKTEFPEMLGGLRIINLDEDRINPSSKEECRCHIKGAYCQIHQKYIQISEPTKEAINMTKDISLFDEPVEKIMPIGIYEPGTFNWTKEEIIIIIRKINEIIFYLNRLDVR